MINPNRTLSAPSFHTGFLISVIQLDLMELDINVNSEEMKFETLLIELEEAHIWLEGIDFYIPLPDEVAKELFEMKYSIE